MNRSSLYTIIKLSFLVLILISSNSPLSAQFHQFQMGDTNGDGAADIVGFLSNGVKLSVAHHNSFMRPKSFNFFDEANGWKSFNRHPRFISDVNGDGKADIVGFGNEAISVALSNGHGFNYPEIWLTNGFDVSNGWTSNHELPRTIADVNGDGRGDIVGFSRNDGVWVALSNGSEFMNPRKWLGNAFDISNGYLNNLRWPRMLADVDDDDRADIIGFVNTDVYVALSTGGAFERPSSWLSNAFDHQNGWENNDENLRFVADVNNDNKADIIGFSNSDGVHVSLSNGNSFGTPTQWLENAFDRVNGYTFNHKYPRLVFDVDNDKLSDVIGFGHEVIVVSLSDGSGFTRPINAWLAPPYSNEIRWWPELESPIDRSSGLGVIGDFAKTVVRHVTKIQGFTNDTAVRIARQIGVDEVTFLVEMATDVERNVNETATALSETAIEIITGGDPELIHAIPLAAAIRAAQDSYKSHARALPTSIKRQLSPLFHYSILDQARFVVDDFRLTIPGVITEFFPEHADAVVVGNIIVFHRDRYENVDLALWAHEVQHIVQYRRMGIEEFALRYIKDNLWGQRTIEDEADRKELSVK